MRLVSGRPRLSATDLANHLGCRHLTGLDLATASGALKPPVWRDLALEALQQRGFQHEAAYLRHLQGEGLDILRLDAEATSAVEQTVAAMRKGVDVIAQATLSHQRWYGRADILRRVERASALGAWSYEVVDTKLARDTRAGTLLQLCLYCDIVGEVQGRLPERMHVVSPAKAFEPESFRVHDFFAYYRFVKRKLEHAVEPAMDAQATYPEPVAQCDICRWWPACDRQRRDDDHLSLVAGLSRLQAKELESFGIDTLENLGGQTLPAAFRPKRGAPESYARVREQARVQLEGRRRKAPVHELLAIEPGHGLTRLPEPSAGDIFFDIEGDPFVGDDGLEYLYGWVLADDAGHAVYEGIWSLHRSAERVGFERFIDTVMARWQRFPEMHVYHFAPYEPGALKRLMGRYATREDEVDRLLRTGVFVDLHLVSRQAVRASVERYSIKDLEAFYGFERAVELRDAAAHLRRFEHALELGTVDTVPSAVRDVVREYNRDDCLSTAALRDWLERLRADLVAAGEPIARPEPEARVPSETLDEQQQRVHALLSRLMQDVRDDRDARSDEEEARWLLAQMLEWHRRESKAPWWEYFRLRDLADEDLFDEKAAIAGLELAEQAGGTRRCPVHRYAFAPQETQIRSGDELKANDGEALGSVEAIDPVARMIDIKKRGAAANVHPKAVFAHSVVNTKVLADALFRLGTWVAGSGVDAPGPYRAARDLLLNRPPRLAAGPAAGALQDAGEPALTAAKRLVLHMQGGVLAIQGPPGAGKTYTGARMVLALVRRGLKVGVTAVSHKVIRNLLDAVVEAAEEEGVTIDCVHKVTKERAAEHPRIRERTGNAAILGALTKGEAQVAGGTAWLWAREEFFECVDVLFVDEAGQMALANVLAVAQAANNVVLLGDPQQLEQPQQGSHPAGTDVSALEHLLAGHKTVPPERGLFLEETWRLHPSICAYTSELFYENRLLARSGLEHQALAGNTPFAGAGLRYEPVLHDANQSSSREEVERVSGIVASLRNASVTWTDRHRASHPLTPDDILIVAPYNAQVFALAQALPDARIGTVDKFQGQEAPVVIYSMATSSPDDAPRGMEFLYSLNRLNVASSRARCVFILVANPRLFEPECRTPRQMQLANAFCRYLECATSRPGIPLP